ncbi:nicotinate-nucleotide adenylyltransferase [Inconstantimicrobium porci]|uniref:Probable nicotinate-nucleotide adenylyltransferase n=1 Tax=Inconstantimicrobium porci TaxID=2652291 RepID=A0A7X2T0P4_9CLOT|nr:nicotinate-nucleotide adenylyltransferase [Inconstantimicrobium porci]MSR90841.1 nicotinate-nucleotide adenylyltransferase [Inconstantimicrobium porci]
MKKIGVFGGSFDPIHNGHLYIAYEAFKELKLDKVIFIPGGNLPHKDSSHMTDSSSRYNMVKLAIKDYKNFEVSDYEIKKETKCYTFETLEHLKSEEKDSELYFIIGADSLINLDTWKCVDRIMKNAVLVVLTRPGYKEAEIESQKEKFEKMYGGKIILLNTLNLEISSTYIRNAVSKNENVDFFLNSSVSRYISENKLYR